MLTTYKTDIVAWSKEQASLLRSGNLSAIDIEHIAKVKRFLYLLSRYVPVKPNISNLSQEMQISRATVSNYIHYWLI